MKKVEEINLNCYTIPNFTIFIGLVLKNEHWTSTLLNMNFLISEVRVHYVEIYSYVIKNIQSLQKKKKNEHISLLSAKYNITYNKYTNLNLC